MIHEPIMTTNDSSAGAAPEPADRDRNRYFVDVYSESLFKKGEELCGDMVDTIRKKDETVVVLADGMGSGEWDSD